MTPHRLTPESIVGVCCDALKVSVDELTGASRHPEVVNARMVVWRQLRLRSRLSYPEIARLTGRPCHSTVLTAERRTDAALLDPESPVAVSMFFTDVAIEAAEAKADGEAKRVQSEAERNGNKPVKLSIQRQVRAIKAQEAAQTSQQPAPVAAVAAPSTGRSVPARLTRENRTRETGSNGHQLASHEKCPNCGWRTYEPEPNNPGGWSCTRCDWRSDGRARKAAAQGEG